MIDYSGIMMAIFEAQLAVERSQREHEQWLREHDTPEHRFAAAKPANARVIEPDTHAARLLLCSEG